MRTSPKRPDVRTHILDTALELVAEHGVSHLTQPRVSRAAGIRQSHLTYYFPRRSDLLVAVARHSMDAVAQPAIDRACQGTLSRGQLADMLVAALTDRRRIRVMLGVIAAADEDARVRVALRELITHVRERIAALLGAFGLPNDADTVALLHTMVVGAAVLHHARADAGARQEAQRVVGVISSMLPLREDRGGPVRRERAP